MSGESLKLPVFADGLATVRLILQEWSANLSHISTISKPTRTVVYLHHYESRDRGWLSSFFRTVILASSSEDGETDVRAQSVDRQNNWYAVLAHRIESKGFPKLIVFSLAACTTIHGQLSVMMDSNFNFSH